MKAKSVFRNTVTLMVIASFLFWNFAVAAPQGGSIAQGSASISQSGTTTTINQTSQNTVINWHGFDTASNESVRFNQPSSSAVALNRITSGLPTTFAGQLTANGQVWILNPAGVLFTNTSKIDVSGLVATTLNIQDSDFMAGKYNLFQSPGALQGSVINNGSITIENDGLVALVAPTVANHGTITATMGRVLLASGTVATIDPYGDNLINFAPNNYAVEGSVTNTGTISANGGKVVMSANSVNKIIKNVVNNGGFIEATNAVQSSNGVIILGGNSGATNIGGTIKSNRIVIKGNNTVISGNLTTPAGGTIETSGDTVTISPDAVINAGQGGLWYMDPLTINISDYSGLVQSQLQAGTNVTLSTGTNLAVAGAGDINVDQAISWNTGASLLLAAYHNINVSQPISSNGGSVVMRADTANNKTGNVIFSGAAAVGGANVMNGGSVQIFYNPPSYNSPTNYPAYFSGSSPVTGFMMINTATDLVNAGAAGSPNSLYNYALTNDISVTGLVATNGVFGTNVTFNGIFDGYDYATGITHTLSGFNLFIGGSNNYIGAIAGINNGTIENLNITSSNVIGVDQSDIGGVVGANYGTISNVYFSGAVIAQTNSLIGGIAGYNTGLLSQVTVNNGGVIGSSTNVNVGGIAGQNTGVIQYAGVLAGGGTTFGVGGRTGGVVGVDVGTGSSCGSGGSICNSYNLAPVSGSGTVGTFLAPTGGIVGSETGTTAIKLVYNTGAVTANGAASANVGPILGDIPGGGGALFIAGWYYDISTCPSCSTLWGSTSLFPFLDANKTLQSTYQQGVGADQFNFGSIWTTNGNTTVPNIKPLVLPVINTVLGEGALSVASAQNVSLYKNGVFQGTSTSNASGVYGFIYDPNSTGTNTFLVTTNAAVKGATLEKINVTGPSPIVGLNITSGLVTVDNVIGVGVFSNTDLAVASGGPTTPYSASGNNLTLNAGVGFLTTAITPYNLNGNITAPGALGITFDNTVSLGASSVLTSGGVIDFTSTVNGGFALTANASGAVIFGGNVGGAAQLTGLTVASNGPITEAGFIKVNGPSSFSAGSNPITLTNVNNIFVGAVTLSNSGANDVQIYNNAALTLAPFNIGGNLTVTTNGSNITLGGSNVTGGGQLYNDPVLLGSTTGLTASAGNITFTSTINGGGFNLNTSTVSPFSTILDANVSNANNVVISGDTIINNALTVSATVFVQFLGSLHGPGSLTITSNFAELGGAVSGLGTLDVTGITFMDAPTVSTTGAQTYHSPMLLTVSTNFTSANGSIAFDSTVDAGNHTITTNTTADPNSTLFKGNLSNVNNLTVNGDTTINNAVQMTVAGTASFNDEFNGPGSLVLTAGNTLISENDSTGIEPGEVALSALTLNGPVTFTGGLVDANTQTYNGVVTIAASSNPTVLGTGSIHFANSVDGTGALVINGNLTASGDINIGSLVVTGTTLFNKGSDQSVTTVNGQNYLNTVTLNNNLNILNTGFGYINFGGGGVVGPTFNLSVINLSGTFTNGITGSVNVNSLTLGGTGGAYLVNSFFNSLQYGVPTFGIFCVNGVCTLKININLTVVPQAQVFIIPAGLTFCAVGGCNNVTINYLDVGLVTEVDGFVEAIDEFGNVRLLMAGDLLFAGETIVTGPDSHICIKLPNGAKKCLGPDEKYKV